MKNKHNLTTYLILAGVFLLSIGGSFFVPANDVIKAVIVAPGVVSLLSVLFQLIRDQAAFEKEQEFQQRQFQFTIGAASHMANAAFDKHAEFSEKYMAEIHKTVRTLFREGETPEALSHAGDLLNLREQYAVWLTDEINDNLNKFESALRKLGANSHFVKITDNSQQYAETRQRIISDNFDLFFDILGIDPKRKINEDYAVNAIKIKVRNILGVEDLTRLRKHLVQEASQVLNSGA